MYFLYCSYSHAGSCVFLHPNISRRTISSSVHVSVIHPKVTSWVELKLLNKKKEEGGGVMTLDIHDWRGMMDMNVASSVLRCLELVVLFHNDLPSRDLSPGLYDGLLHTCSFGPLIKMSQVFSSAFSMMKSCYSVHHGSPGSRQSRSIGLWARRLLIDIQTTRHSRM